MASSADVRDIMGMAPQDTTITKDSILGTDKKKYFCRIIYLFKLISFEGSKSQLEIRSSDLKECTENCTTYCTVKIRNSHVH